MALIDIVSSIVSGGATGLIGAAISRYADYKTKQLDIEVKKIDYEHAIELKHADARIVELEWSSRERIVEVESEAKVEIEDSKAFLTALTSEPQLFSGTGKLTRFQKWMMVVLDFIRGVIRPSLTLYLCAISTAVYLQAGAIIKTQNIPIADAVNIYTQISSTILYLTTTVVLFYFGIRNRNDKDNGG